MDDPHQNRRAEKFRLKTSADAAALPAEEHKIWRIRQVCPDGSGILLSALSFGGEEIFLKLVRRLKYQTGFAPMVDATGKGYLHIAVERRYERATKQILDDGILTNSADKAGKTALMYAIEMKSAVTVQLLLERGVRIISDDDTTAAQKTLRIAEESGNDKIRELIRAAFQREQALRKKHQTQS